ncbi:MAG: hypothetical protein MAG715_00398 [Methanonatronarchaeales archaeon]|nr:hypothetical protein [Methanonatronarchaeales archaeon]
MPRRLTDLPFGDAFSPGSLRLEDKEGAQLPLVLELVRKHEGDPDEFDQEIADTFYQNSSEPLVTAKNVRLGLGPSGYQLVDEDFRFTEIGDDVRREEGDEVCLQGLRLPFRQIHLGKEGPGV